MRNFGLKPHQHVEIVKVAGPPLIAEVVVVVLFISMVAVWSALASGA